MLGCIGEADHDYFFLKMFSSWKELYKLIWVTLVFSWSICTAGGSFSNFAPTVAVIISLTMASCSGIFRVQVSPQPFKRQLTTFESFGRQSEDHTLQVACITKCLIVKVQLVVTTHTSTARLANSFVCLQCNDWVVGTACTLC